LSRSRRKILLITYTSDHCATLVENAVRRQGGECIRLNTDLFPWTCSLACGFKSHDRSPRLWLRYADETNRRWNLRDAGAVWYRREAQPALPRIAEAERTAAFAEIRAYLEGLYDSLSDIPWVDPLPRITAAENKFRQLHLASRCGLNVPRTLATNDPTLAGKFIAKCEGRIVIKSISPLTVRRRNKEFSLFTTKCNPSPEQLQGLRFAPLIFQEEISKERDVRVNVVGNSTFSVSISANDSKDIPDWRFRKNSEITISPEALPFKVNYPGLKPLGILGDVFNTD